MNMIRAKRWLTFMLMLGLITVGMSSSALAVTDSDVSTTIVEPESGDEVSAGDFLTGGVDYVVELENTGSNDTTADTYIELTSDGDTESVWVNDTSVDADETTELRDELSVDSFDLNEDGDDATITVESTYTDDSDSSTATSSDTVDFELIKSTAFSSIFGMLILVAVIGIFSKDL